MWQKKPYHTLEDNPTHQKVHPHCQASYVPLVWIKLFHKRPQLLSSPIKAHNFLSNSMNLQN